LDLKGGNVNQEEIDEDSRRNRLPKAGMGKRFIVAFTNIMHLRRIYLLFKYEKIQGVFVNQKSTFVNHQTCPYGSKISLLPYKPYSPYTPIPNTFSAFF